jgi:UDP-glucose 4-epimerase
MKNKIKSVVTGGSGFIGSHLVDLLLSHDHEVVIIDNLSSGNLDNIKHISKKIIIHKEDITSKGKFINDVTDCDFLFHIAGLADVVPSIDRPMDYYNANVLGTLNIANILRDNKNIKKVIYAASSSCYGIPVETPTTEECPIDTRYPYANTKHLGENIIMHFGKVYKIPTISMRFFNVYGTRARTTGTYGAVFGTFLAQKLANSPYTIVGDGEQKRDFIHVSDLIEGIYSASQSTIHSDIFNLGTGKPHSINELVDIIGGEKIYIPKRPGEPDITQADISKISQKLNWTPKISFEEGVKNMLENISYWKDAPLWTPEKIDLATKNWFKHLA